MPKRSLHRLTTAIYLAAAPALSLAASPMVTKSPTTTTAKLPSSMPSETAVPLKQAIPGSSAAPAVITGPSSKKSSADTDQSYATRAVPKTVAASTTGPATAPTTAVASGPPLNPAPPATQPADISADAELAERLCSLAQASIPLKVASNDQWPAIWQQAGALLSAAVKLNPGEGRFARLLTEVMLQSHDDAGAIDALGKARRASPDDQFAQAQIIDLYVNRMETAVQKIAYLKDLLGRSAIAEPIRSHAGVACASLLLDRGETETARNVLGEALRLNPYNSAGLHLRYNTLPATASNFERCSALMAILRASPAQPDVAAALADKLAAVGIVEDSLPWFNLAENLYARSGRPSLDLALNLACELYIAKQLGAANSLTDQLCKISPAASGNWFLKIILSHARGNEQEYQQSIQQANNALSNALVTLLPRAPGQPAPTTRPIETAGAYPLPDLQPAVDFLNKTDAAPASVQQRQQLQLAIADLATLQVYFAQKPGDAAKLIAALKQTNPNSPTVARLEGFSALFNGKADDAKKSFESCRGKDPLGELGLIRLQAANPANQQSGSLAGRALLNAHPSGLLGAFLIDGLRDLRCEIILSKEADSLKQQVGMFPTGWLRVLDTPQNFYALRVDPIGLARNYGEPLLARLTVMNLTDQPLPLGADGVLKPDLWFNARLRGGVEQTMEAVAYDRLAGPLVLNPRQTFSQVIRLDQGALQQAIDSNFAQTIEIIGGVNSNPQPLTNGQVASAPGGYKVVFAHPFSRLAEPMNSPAAQKSLTDIATGRADDKFAAIDLLGAYMKACATAPNPNDANLRQTVGVFEDTLHKSTGDPIAAVAAWASLTAIQSTPSASAEQQIADLSQDADWRKRQISLLLTNTLNAAGQRRIAAALLGDPEPSVRAAAEARMKLLDVSVTPAKK